MSASMRLQEGQAGSGPRPKMNASSDLLTKEENEIVFGLLGKKCQSFVSSYILYVRLRFLAKTI
ncbi:unnamed protein product [Ceratitis capitata]|uniref:(Mediterranean fruit fly) hypothetical protein n=1 Tax=Ceratitis capitata TaxID=7213 RepID=A0A811U7D3_CERCA|nr:unnamed protein product [Ceratitis capitata]